MTDDLQSRIDQTALAMVGMSPEQRHQLFVDAWRHALLHNPDHIADDVPPAVCAFVAAVIERVYQFEREMGSA
jgi:hypothetical protein